MLYGAYVTIAFQRYPGGFEDILADFGFKPVATMRVRTYVPV